MTYAKSHIWKDTSACRIVSLTYFQDLFQFDRRLDGHGCSNDGVQLLWMTEKTKSVHLFKNIGQSLQYI